MDQCEECGFIYDLNDAPAASGSVRSRIAEVVALLRRRDADLLTRRSPEVWSPLEYGCHLRDVLLVQRERVLAARRTDRLEIAPMGRDERVEHDGYAQQDPQDVARQLTDAAQLFAGVLDRLGDEDWAREVVYPYPEPTGRSLKWVALHTVHEAQHHLADIRSQLG